MVMDLFSAKAYRDANPNSFARGTEAVLGLKPPRRGGLGSFLAPMLAILSKPEGRAALTIEKEKKKISDDGVSKGLSSNQISQAQEDAGLLTAPSKKRATLFI